MYQPPNRFDEGGFADRGTDESGKGSGRDGTENVCQGLRGLASDNPAVRRVIESLTKVMAALEAAGIEFINEGAASTAMRVFHELSVEEA